MTTKTNNRGILIAIEGIDGSGKTTLLKTLENYLQKNGISVFALPSGGFSPTDVEAKLRAIVVTEDSNVSKETEALIYVAGLAQKVGQYVEPALNEYKVVIVDRFILSALVFARYMHGLDGALANEFLQFASKGLKPDFTFLCDIDENIAYSRMLNRGAPLTKREKKGASTMQTLRNGFLQLISETTANYTIIDTALTPIEELENSIKIIDEYVK